MRKSLVKQRNIKKIIRLKQLELRRVLEVSKRFALYSDYTGESLKDFKWGKAII